MAGAEQEWAFLEFHPNSLGWSGAAAQLLALVYLLKEVVCTASEACKRA